MLVKDAMTGNPAVIDAEVATVSDAMSKMRELDINQIPALNGKEYRGMLNYREIIRRQSIRLSAKAETFIVSTPEINPDQEIEDVISLFIDSGLSALPVISGKKLAGILSRTDIIRNLEEIPSALSLRNRQIMSSSPVTVEENDNVDSAATKMRGLDETEIPVVDSRGKLTGILRLDDIAADTFRREKQSIRGTSSGESVYTGSIAGEKLKVDVKCFSLMDNPFWVDGGDPVTGAAELMLKQHLHLIPVVDDDMKVEGVVSISDILEAVARRGEKEGMIIQVTGLDPEERDIYDVTYAMASKFLLRFSRITGLSNGKLNIHIIKYHSEGRVKYSVRTKIVAEPLIMSLDHHDWNYGKCLSFIFETYEPRLRKWRTK